MILMNVYFGFNEQNKCIYKLTKNVKNQYIYNVCVCVEFICAR